MTKEAFNRKKRIFCCKLDLNFLKRLVKRYVWPVLLNGPESWAREKLKRTKLKLLKTEKERKSARKHFEGE